MDFAEYGPRINSECLITVNLPLYVVRAICRRNWSEILREHYLYTLPIAQFKARNRAIYMYFLMRVYHDKHLYSANNSKHYGFSVRRQINLEYSITIRLSLLQAIEQIKFIP